MLIRSFSRVVLLMGAVLLGAIRPTLAADISNFSPTFPPAPVPDVSFTDDAGRLLYLHNFKGRVVLLNLWATWCAPCIAEMPSLNNLQRRLGGPRFMVLPVSLDRGELRIVQDFISSHGLSYLPVLREDRLSVSRLIMPRGMPLTLLIDREGREVGRAYGAVAWDDEAMLKLINKLSNN